MAELEDGVPQPLSVYEAAEWQVHYQMKAELMEKHVEEVRAKTAGGKGKGNRLQPDLQPPTMGSRRK